MVSSSINQENTLVTHRGTIVLLNKVVQPCYINAFISIASVRDSNNFIACHFFVKPTPYNHGPQGNNNRWYSCPINTNIFNNYNRDTVLRYSDVYLYNTNQNHYLLPSGAYKSSPLFIYIIYISSLINLNIFKYRAIFVFKLSTKLK